MQLLNLVIRTKSAAVQSRGLESIQAQIVESSPARKFRQNVVLRDSSQIARVLTWQSGALNETQILRRRARARPRRQNLPGYRPIRVPFRVAPAAPQRQLSWK